MFTGACAPARLSVVDEKCGEEVTLIAAAGDATRSGRVERYGLKGVNKRVCSWTPHPILMGWLQMDQVRFDKAHGTKTRFVAFHILRQKGIEQV